MSRSAQSIATIEEFLNRVDSATKTAAEANTEPGSIGGETSHPVKNVDDRTEDATTGERASENSKDVKEDQGAAAVDAAPEAKAAALRKKAEGALMTPGSAADDHLQIGMNVQATGDDPSHETESVKAKKDDKRQGDRGGTSHPASTENDELDGHKYAFDDNTPLEKLAAMAQELGESLCADLAAAASSPQPQQQQQKQAGTARPQQQQTMQPAVQYQLGWELAALSNGTMDKQAADRMVIGELAEMVKEAEDDAIRVASYYRQTFAEMQKQAEGDEEPPPGAGGDGGAGMGGDESGMMAALGGAEGGPPPGAGGPPPGESGGGAGGGQEAEMQQLLQLLDQLGITPEQLEQALASSGGGGAGGGEMPPGAGAPPPGAGAGGPPSGAPPGMEVAASDRQGKQATDKAAEMRAYVTELISRSRRR